MLILASASPRRKELISLISDDVKIIPSDADESYDDTILSEAVPEMLAVRKAASVAKLYPDDTVIGCDTSVIVDGTILGKPTDEEDAARMLSLLSGRTHKVITGCAIFHKGKSVSFSDETEVEFYMLSSDEIENYIKSGEPMDKAGAYGIQGKAALFVKSINGDYFNIVGLPVSRLNRILNNFI